MREFSAGPRLGDTPDGDPRRQAVASLRGYAYQLYASALAWIGLKSGQVLFLEVAEDYAVVADGALKGVQVKDTAKSGSLTINNQDVLDALDSYVDLVSRNPDSKVSLRFLTTASLGRERDLADRVDGHGVLEYWRHAAAGADVAPLKKALLNAPISANVRRFIEARDEFQLRDELLRSIHWDCKQDGLLDISAQLELSLIEFASDRLQLSPTDCADLPQVVIGEVLDAIVRPGSQRRLCLADLLKICEAHAKTAISTSTLARLVAMQWPAEPKSTALQAATLLEPIDGVPLPANIAPRRALIDSALSLLRGQQFLVLIGGSGLGKTLAARMTATEYGGRWLIVDLRDVPAPETSRRLEAVFAQVATNSFDGIILDDLNELESATVCQRVARLVAAIWRRDAACIVTCYKHPSISVAERLGAQSLPVIPVGKLTLEEVRDLVQAAGGSSERAALLAFWHGGQGHPQLVRAFISIARRGGWSVLESTQEPGVTSIQADLKSEQRQLRHSLIERFDKGTRTLLYRVSLLLGRFDRSLAMQVGEVAPAIDLAGESLDQLIGPWIDDIGSGRLRVSPLVDRAGEEILSSQEQTAVHRRAAEFLGEGNTLDVSRAEALYVHALKGSADSILTKVALAVMATDQRRLKDIADWMPSLVGASVHHPIYTQNLHVSRYLRFAQVLLLADSDDAARKLAAWTALCGDINAAPEEGEAALFEYMVLCKVLISPGLARIFPNPVQLLERHHALTLSSSRFRSFVAEVEQNGRPEDGTPMVVSSVLFVTQAIEVGTIERQRRLFLELGHLSSEARAKYFGAPNNMQQALHSLVNAAWLSEVKAGTLDWARASDAFLELANLAATWEQRDLALYFHLARCVMIDEYGHQPEQAMKSLDEAEAALGADAIISRGRAKVHFRNRRFAESLSVVENTSSYLGKHDPLERLFLCRETAISAAKIGDWAKCCVWMQAGLDASLRVREKRLRPMLIGLKADHALASYRAGDHADATTEMGEVLSSLAEIDDDTSTRAIYCHRVVHHGLLWMYSQACGRHSGIEVDGAPPWMEAGMCSNPEPPETIREQPRTSKVTAWHLLAAIESRHLGSRTARELLDQRLGGRLYPSLEFMTRSSLLASSILRMDADEFVQFISPWIDVCAHFYSNGDEMRRNSPASPTEGEISSVSDIQLVDERVSGHARDAILSFAVNAALCGRIDALHTLRTALANLSLPGDGPAMLKRMLRPDDAPPDDTKVDYICSAVHSVLKHPALSHDQLFSVTLRLVQALYGSAFRYALEDQVVRWVKRNWRSALEARFGFKSPNVFTPAIASALDLDGLAGVAAVLLAAEPALNVRVSPDFRQWLRTVS
jgi:hypothetical protein